MNKKDKIRKMKGITLVSLVVTIIVLIILAGVSINLTLGENGIITMAKRARENMELAKEDEERQLNELYMQMEQEGISGENSDDLMAKLIEFKREIARAITDMGIETAENADVSTMSSNIRSLTGASSADKVSYDNTNSGLTSTNVQGAVDEIDGDVTELNSTLSWYIEKGFLPDPSNYNEALIPVLSSDIGSNGIASVSSSYSGRNAYYAFDGNESTNWLPPDAVNGAYLMYQFTSPKLITKTSINIISAYSPSNITFYVQASNDGNNWTDLTSFTSSRGVHEFEFEDNIAYTHYRIRTNGMMAQSSTGYWAIASWQLYGHV